MNLVNTHILLSYKKVFKDNRTIENLMKNKITKNHIFLYSTLSFHKYQNTDLRIKKWSLNHIKEILRKKDVEFKNNYIISRHQRLILLKYLLINITTQNKSKHYNKELKLLYKLF